MNKSPVKIRKHGLFLGASESDDAAEMMLSPRASSSHHREPKSRTKLKESTNQMKFSPLLPTVPETSPTPQLANPKIARNKAPDETENSEEDEEFAELDAWLQSGCVSFL